MLRLPLTGTFRYLVLPEFFEQDAVQQMLSRAKQLIEEVDLATHPMTAFTTAEQGCHVGDQYFLDSSSRISAFFEPSALDPSDPHKLIVPKEQSINKIGHALCQLDPVFRSQTLENQRLQDLARELGVHKDPLVLQSMIICKQPRIGGKVTQRFVKLPEGGTGFVDLPGSQKEAETKWDEESGWKQECCGAGDLVLIHGGVQHQSPPNLSDKTRFIYTFHMIEGQDGYTYDERNW
ncbi:hypothetical protein QFC19_001191 [Naganishia cerealis]|uniref:Uncharacterized protein n=1 Tax=Naganishia cerealis TaxID=610337 RepID=A0ACC2WLJ8_9TREE|nr:hypothetical protein QFC19_001191 [Naganishia cerealis]